MVLLLAKIANDLVPVIDCFDVLGAAKNSFVSRVSRAASKDHRRDLKNLFSFQVRLALVAHCFLESLSRNSSKLVPITMQSSSLSPTKGT